MDDLKIYSRGRKELSTTMNVVERVSKAIGMELGLKKCAVPHMVKQDTYVEDHILPEERVIESLTHKHVYRYLGVEQLFKLFLRTIKEWVKHSYLDQLKRVWSLKLNARLKVLATNIRAVSVFRDFFFPEMVME